jgi:hypothetical protein
MSSSRVKYFNKYLKYKGKYEYLKSQLGGIDPVPVQVPIVEKKKPPMPRNQVKRDGDGKVIASTSQQQHQ